MAPQLLARSAAGVAGLCAVVHGVLSMSAPAGWAGAGQLMMTVACLPCAVHLWRRPGPAAWSLHVVLALLMLLAHPLSTALGPVHGHVHGGTSAVAALAGSAGAVAVPVLAGTGLFLAVFRWWLGSDVPLGRAAQSSFATASGGSVRRVPQA